MTVLIVLSDAMVHAEPLLVPQTVDLVDSGYARHVAQHERRGKDFDDHHQHEGTRGLQFRSLHFWHPHVSSRSGHEGNSTLCLNQSCLLSVFMF